MIKKTKYNKHWGGCRENTSWVLLGVTGVVFSSITIIFSRGHVLLTFLLLWQKTMTKECIQKKGFIWAYDFRMLRVSVNVMGGGLAASTHGSWSSKRRPHILSHRIEAEKHWEWHEALKSQSQQHISFSKLIPLKLSQIAPPTGGQAFKHLSLWGIFLFKLPWKVQTKQINNKNNHKNPTP